MKTFVHTLIRADANLRLQLTNNTTAALRSVEILTVFLADKAAPGSPSRAHITFSPVAMVRPHEDVAVPHKIWINGKPVDDEDDHLALLETREGVLKPYVLDISWLNAEGKTCYQRIPVGY